jgi:hypothetical protein
MTVASKSVVVARARQAAKKRAWRRRSGDGLAVLRLEADPLDVAEFLAEAGIVVAANADSEALGKCLTDLIRRWHDGRLALLCPPVDIPDGDAPVD